MVTVGGRGRIRVPSFPDPISTVQLTSDLTLRKISRFLNKADFNYRSNFDTDGTLATLATSVRTAANV
jgi:hypothetical protein